MTKDDSTIDLSKLGSEDTSDASLSEDFDVGGSDHPVAPADNDSLTEVSDGHEEFKIHHLDGAELHEAKPLSDQEVGKLEAVRGPGDVAAGPASKVKVKFDKFITLVATHTYEDVLRKNAAEDVIISTNLLTDLANAHEESSGSKRLPVLFVFGLVLGIVLTWLILKT